MKNQYQLPSPKLFFYLPSLFLVGHSQSLSLLWKELIQTRIWKKINGSAIALTSRRPGEPDFAEIEIRPLPEIGNLPLVTPPEFQRSLQHWMESNETRSKEEFLELMKLEVDAILHRAIQSDATEKRYKTTQRAT